MLQSGEPCNCILKPNNNRKMEKVTLDNFNEKNSFFAKVLTDIPELTLFKGDGLIVSKRAGLDLDRKSHVIEIESGKIRVIGREEASTLEDKKLFPVIGIVRD